MAWPPNFKGQVITHVENVASSHPGSNTVFCFPKLRINENGGE